MVVPFRAIIGIEHYAGTPEHAAYYAATVLLEDGTEREYCASTLGVVLAMLVEELDFDAKFFNDDPRVPVGGDPAPLLSSGAALDEPRKERVNA